MSDIGERERGGAYIEAEYQLTGPRNRGEALARARDICLEQTVEYPEDLIDNPRILENIAGRLLDLERVGRDHYRAVIGFPVEVAGSELTHDPTSLDEATRKEFA